SLIGVPGGRLARLTVSKEGKQIAKGQLDLLRGRPNVADFQANANVTGGDTPTLRIMPSVALVNASKGGKTGTVKGTVRDAQDKPVPRALVNLQGLAVARTDSSGRYSFINVPEGAYQMTVRQSGMKPRAEQVQVSAAN